MCATQWFTPIKGTDKRLDIPRAIAAPTRKHGPKPGPCEKETAPMSVGDN